jgi:hypothetical protein
MNKFFLIVISFFVFECFCLDANGQRNRKNEQLYIMSTELLKTDKSQLYLEARKKMNAVLQETAFPHPFIIWSSGDSYFHVWHPIEEMNELSLINRAWNVFDELHGTDLLAPVEECIESKLVQVMTAYLDLSYEPDEISFTEDATSFCRMRQFYLKNGSKQEVMALAEKLVELFESKKSTRDIYFGEGTIGFERPVLLCWSFANSQQDYLDKEARINEELGEEYQEIMTAISNHIRRTEIIDFHYVDGLSYSIF